MFKLNDGVRTIDTVEVRKVLPGGTLDMSPEGLILETNNHPSIIQRIMKYLGLYKCAGDAMMNYGLQHLATAIYDHYGFVSVGTSAATPDDYTLNDVVAPVFVRVPAAKSYVTTFIENDTAVFVGIFTPSGSSTVIETGLHTALTGGHMGARQTSCNIPTTINVEIGIMWKICVARA